MLGGILRIKPFKDVTLGSILGGLLVVCLLTLGIFYWLAITQMNRARAVLQNLSDLRLGTSPFADVQRIAERYGGIPWYITSDDMSCTFQRCKLAFHSDNKPLSYVPGVGYTGFFAAVDIKDGIVNGRELDYERSGGVGGYFRYVVFDFDGPPPKGWAYGVWRLKVDPRDPHGVPHVLQVNLGPSSTDDLRRRAYSLNLSCLARFHGCGGPSAIYPSGLRYLGPPSQGFVPGEQ